MIDDVEAAAGIWHRDFGLPRTDCRVGDGARNLALFAPGDPFVDGKRRSGVHHVALAGGTAIAQQSPAPVTVKIGTTPSFIVLPVFAAEHLGYLKPERLAVQFVDFEDGAEVTTPMVGGSIAAGATMVERPMTLAEKGFGAKNLVALTNRNPLFLVIENDHAAKEAEEETAPALLSCMGGPRNTGMRRAMDSIAGKSPHTE
jgi:hypothetical protein